MTQQDLTGMYCARPENFAWFIGAGASRTAGLPTAWDVLWDLKRRYYCQEENQEISRQDVQQQAVRARIQEFMDSRGFPPEHSENEYSLYFNKIFGADKERQRRYLHKLLSEENLSLSIGHRILGALLASGHCRAAFTTNFDSVIERAFAEVSGRSLSAYHLEGSQAAIQALNNEEYPIYCKLHGDFRYDSLKNLSEDLKNQNADLAKCLVNAGNRFGFVVAGYSGRDKSIMDLFYQVLDSPNPFPHGFYWTGLKGSSIPPAVDALLDHARERGVDARYIPIETFDTLLSRIWRNIDDKPSEFGAKVHRTHLSAVDIPMPSPGKKRPILRLNALPVVELPQQCLKLTFAQPKTWDDVKQAQDTAQGRVFIAKTDAVYCWGNQSRIQQVFADDPPASAPADLPANIGDSESLALRGFMERALCAALTRDKPLLTRHKQASFVVANAHASDLSQLEELKSVTQRLSGTVPGVTAPVTDMHPEPTRVTWAEATRVALDFKNGVAWLVIDPDIWIWPPRARSVAAAFMNDRRRDRLNQKYNELIDAWAHLLLGTTSRDTEVTVSAFEGPGGPANPSFRLRTRTAYSGMRDS
ncbi:MAG: SIR2 family protein [Spiribacter salinus]|uniref:SIR2 family protein n=1 Tax=Spiribacter salinus TaxID=1335746 RepID=A0A540VS54_9GAMM|nr:MAG: SIR2 family protein [Spiribacter salinus]